jgi:hypothetical protein
LAGEQEKSTPLRQVAAWRRQEHFVGQKICQIFCMCAPMDAIVTYRKSGIDALVMAVWF